MRGWRGSRGTAIRTRVANAPAPTATTPTSGRPMRMPADAVAPPGRMADGDVMARATGGVKKRSRKDRRGITSRYWRLPRREVRLALLRERGHGLGVLRCLPALAQRLGLALLHLVQVAGNGVGS